MTVERTVKIFNRDIELKVILVPLYYLFVFLMMYLSFWDYFPYVMEHMPDLIFAFFSGLGLLAFSTFIFSKTEPFFKSRRFNRNLLILNTLIILYIAFFEFKPASITPISFLALIYDGTFSIHGLIFWIIFVFIVERNVPTLKQFLQVEINLLLIPLNISLLMLAFDVPIIDTTITLVFVNTAFIMNVYYNYLKSEKIERTSVS